MQISGALYYLTNSTNRQNLQNYLCHTISDVVSELGHINIVIFLFLFILSFTRINGSLGYSLTNLGSVWSKPIISAIFLLLRFVSMFKMMVAILRCGIKSRKYQLTENKLELIPDYDKSMFNSDDRIKSLIEKLNNKCIICYDELIEKRGDNISKESEESIETNQKLILSCDHVFHSNCFKEWYLASDQCPYCRKDVKL